MNGSCISCAFLRRSDGCSFQDPRVIDDTCLDSRLCDKKGTSGHDRNKVVAVSGGFDPVHAGHVRMILEAAKLGDRLVVIVNNDDFLIKKKRHVFMAIEERMEIINSIKGVDQVVCAIDEDQSVCKTLEMIRPDIFANGGDRKNETDLLEVDVCRKIGCEMVFNVGGGKIQSSSLLVERSKLHD